MVKEIKGGKTLAERLAEAGNPNVENPPISTENSVVTTNSEKAQKKAKKKPTQEVIQHKEKSDFGIVLVEQKKGGGYSLNESKHRKFKALCALQGKTQEEWIEAKIEEAIAHLNIKDLR